MPPPPLSLTYAIAVRGIMSHLTRLTEVITMALVAVYTNTEKRSLSLYFQFIGVNLIQVSVNHKTKTFANNVQVYTMTENSESDKNVTNIRDWQKWRRTQEIECQTAQCVSNT